MDAHGLKFLALDTGIERIIRQSDHADAQRLPGTISKPLLPSEELPAQYLDQTLKKPSLEQQLLAFLKPDIKEKGILIPARYQALMKDVRNKLLKAAEKAERPGKGDALSEAAGVLEEELKQMALLNMYRRVLLRG